MADHRTRHMALAIDADKTELCIPKLLRKLDADESEQFRKGLNMLKIDDVMHKLCEAGAQSVRRYAQVSGEDPWTMPEFFMPSFILDHLGNEITATLETGFDTMVEWNIDIRKRRGLPEPQLRCSEVSHQSDAVGQTRPSRNRQPVPVMFVMALTATELFRPC